MGADFAPFAEMMRAEGLPEPAIRCFAHYYGELASGSGGTLSRREIGPVESVESADDLGDRAAAGHEALARTVVIKLNGGLGTTMGMRRAKSLLTVRGVGGTVDEARWALSRASGALEGMQFAVGALTTSPLRFETADAIGADGKRFSGAITYTYGI